MALVFPDLGAPKTVPLFTARNRTIERGVKLTCPECQHEHGEDETDEEFEARAKKHAEQIAKFDETLGKVRYVAKLVDLDRYKHFRKKLKKANEEERARLRDLKKKHSQEDWPELYLESYSTDAGDDDIIAISREVHREVMAGLEGFSIGDGGALKDVSTIKDVETLIKLLEQHKWHALAMHVALDAQRVQEHQLLS